MTVYVLKYFDRTGTEDEMETIEGVYSTIEAAQTKIFDYIEVENEYKQERFWNYDNLYRKSLIITTDRTVWTITPFEVRE